MTERSLNIAMLSIHSSPFGDLGLSDTGGMSVYVRELARELGRCGHQIDIYTRHNEPTGTAVIVLGKNVRLIQLQAPTNNQTSKADIYPYLPSYFRALVHFTKQHPVRYDIIHSHYWLSGILGSWLSQIWHIPHVTMFHTLGAVKNKSVPSVREPGLRIAMEKRLSKTCSRIIVASEREKHNLIHYYHASSDNIAVVPCGVNLNHFTPLNKRVVRTLLDFDSDETILLYVGRFDPMKGVERLLEAMQHLNHRNKLRLVIIGGDGNQSSAYRQFKRLTKKLRIEDRVHFVGRVDQQRLPHYYSAADVLLVPSHYESFCLVALEALACGTPVIATPVGAIDTILCEGKTGHVVRNPSSVSFAKSIELFIREDHNRFFSASEIRASVLTFDWPNVAAAIIDKYTDLMNDHQHASSAYNLLQQQCL